MRRWVVVSLVALALLAPGCSLAFDFSRFHGSDGGADTDDSGVDAGPDVDASPGLDSGVDAGPGLMDAGSSDTGSSDTGSPDTGIDAGPGLDAGSSTDAGIDGGGSDAGSLLDAGTPTECTGFRSPITIPLGPIAGLASTIPSNVSFAVRSVGSDVAVAWVDATNRVRLHAFHVDTSADTVTDLFGEAMIGTALSSGALVGIGREGNTWVVWGYTPTMMVRCTDSTSACVDVTRPTGGASPYAFAQAPTNFALVHSASSVLEWRASILGGASLALATQPSHIVTPDAVAVTDTSYVAILDRSYLGAEQIAFTWFDAPLTGTTVATSASPVGAPINSIYVTYDRATHTAVGVAATASPLTTHLLAASRGTPATELTSWSSSSPRPIVTRGDGTIFVADATGYGLRSLGAPGAVVDRPGDPGTVGAPVVIDGMYGYVAIYDMATDEMALKLYPCL